MLYGRSLGKTGNFVSRISLFPQAKLRETLRFEGNKMNYFQRDQALSDLLSSSKF